MSLATARPMQLAFVSDVVCPWCVLGLRALESALATLGDSLACTLQLEPYQLNPGLPPEGEDIGTHLRRKYGSTPEAIERNQARLKALGAEVGFRFELGQRSRIVNTFDAHRLLHWAGHHDPAAALRLKQALFVAYFTDGQDVSAQAVLLSAARVAGLDADAAAAVLAGDAEAEAVREREDFWRHQGLRGVPALVVNGRHLVEGAQTAEVYAQILTRIAADYASPASA